MLLLEDSLPLPREPGLEDRFMVLCRLSLLLVFGDAAFVAKGDTGAATRYIFSCLLKAEQSLSHIHSSFLLGIH